MPSSPTPVPTPPAGLPTGNPGYINNSTSGTLPTTGTSGCDFSGPWFIETQEMEIDYIRIPHHNPTTYDINLSGNPTVTYNIMGTKCVARTTATVSRQKIEYECFDTSSWQQSQKFAVLGASADHNGSSYGTNAEFTSSSLGPTGKVLTYQPYYHRRPWLASDIASSGGVTSTNTVYNTAYKIRLSLNCNGAADWSGLSLEENFWEGSYDFFMWAGPVLDKRSTHRAGNNVAIEDAFGVGSPNYWLAGQYEYNKETFYGLTNFVNIMGNKLRDEGLYPDVPGTSGPDAGLPDYDPTRHDWS